MDDQIKALIAEGVAPREAAEMIHTSWEKFRLAGQRNPNGDGP
jgi:hypothetical protein